MTKQAKIYSGGVSQKQLVFYHISFKWYKIGSLSRDNAKRLYLTEILACVFGVVAVAKVL